MPDDAQQQPWKAGIVAGRHQFSREKVTAVEHKISAAADLADLAKEFLFFSPALLYCGIDLGGRNPLADFCDEQSVEVVPLRLTFDTPVLGGLSRFNPAWDHTLYALPLADGYRFISWLGSLTFVDRGRQEVARVRYRKCPIVDPLWRAKQTTLDDNYAHWQRVDVYLICVDSNLGCLYFSSDLNPPTLRFRAQPQPDTVEFAKALFAGSERPLHDAEKALAVDGVSLAEQEIIKRVNRYHQGQGDALCPHPATPFRSTPNLWLPPTGS